MTNDDHTGTGVPAREGGADSLSAARSVPLPGPPQPRPKSRTKAARDDGQPLRAASVIFRVKALAGLEDALATGFAGLWDAAAPDVNDTVIPLG